MTRNIKAAAEALIRYEGAAMSIVAVSDPDMIRDVAAAYLARPQALHFVFDGPPGPEAGRFVECETPDGRSVNAGEWHERADGFWELRVPFAATTYAEDPRP